MSVCALESLRKHEKGRTVDLFQILDYNATFPYKSSELNPPGRLLTHSPPTYRTLHGGNRQANTLNIDTTVKMNSDNIDVSSVLSLIYSLQ